MRKIILVGRSECGKTTLTQALSGKKIEYQKTQAVNNHELIIDTPGEYIQTKTLGGALALYSYESDIVGLLISATEPFSLYSPNITGQATREVIGIVTKIDHKNADADRAERWLRLCGCKKIFRVSSYTGEGIDELLDYLTKKQKKPQKTT
ncbi:MAG: EutP/PduV family microcompartment system protein [Clostridia bacterium]|nr:EutP/PduV family microcompartment system protein [Clostridia bacterium]